MRQNARHKVLCNLALLTHEKHGIRKHLPPAQREEVASVISATCNGGNTQLRIKMEGSVSSFLCGGMARAACDSGVFEALPRRRPGDKRLTEQHGC